MLTECGICGKDEYSTKDNRCHGCGASIVTFNSKNNVDFDCTECSKTFSSKENVLYHRKNTHSADVNSQQYEAKIGKQAAKERHTAARACV